MSDKFCCLGQISDDVHRNKQKKKRVSVYRFNFLTMADSTLAARCLASIDEKRVRYSCAQDWVIFYSDFGPILASKCDTLNLFVARLLIICLTDSKSNSTVHMGCRTVLYFIWRVYFQLYRECHIPIEYLTVLFFLPV